MHNFVVAAVETVHPQTNERITYVRPNNSALSLAKICQSPFGAICAYILLLGICIHSGAAQTRLNSTQVVPLKGAAQGPFASVTLRDYNSVLDHATSGQSTPVNSAISACGVTITCSIIVPPSYTTTDSVPGFQLNYAIPSAAASTSGNVTIFDHRYGDAHMSVNGPGYLQSLNSSADGWLYQYYAKAAQNAQLDIFMLRQSSLDGGTSQQTASLNYSNKIEWATVLSNEISHTPGQHLNLAIGGRTTSLGDFDSINNSVTCYGGYTTEGDLGCHAQDNFVAQGNVEYSGTLTGSPTTGITSLSVAPTQGAYTQGSARFLARTSAGTITAGTISNISTPTITGSGTAWPVSTVNAQLGTNIAYPGSAVVTPAGFTVGAMSKIQTSSLICVADSASFEMIYPTAVTATTFTAKFAKIHTGNATIAVGGLCGYVLDITADDVTNATYPTKSQTLTGTLHFAWPMISSSSATSGSVWVQADGVLAGFVSRFNPSTANGYVLYPYAEVTSVQQGGGLSNTLTVSPNNVAWTAGDTVSEFLYPAFHATFGNGLVESYYPNISGANGFSLQYNLPLQGSDAMLSLTNNGPASFYQSHGGRYYAPTGLNLYGPTNHSLSFDQAPDTAAIAVACGSSCSNYNATVVAAGNPVYYDFLAYDQVNLHWRISEDSYGNQYQPVATYFASPFYQLFMANDNNSQGYLAVFQMRSGTSANTDLNGELVFASATAVTQSLAGIYAGHPECLARPQFDAGSGNRHWISYSGSSFTIHFAAPVSGAVTYACSGRS